MSFLRQLVAKVNLKRKPTFEWESSVVHTQYLQLLEEVVAFALMLLCKYISVINLMNSVVQDYTASPFNCT